MLELAVKSRKMEVAQPRMAISLEMRNANYHF